METCYTNLANAIILAAAKDHRRALRRLKKYPWDKDAESVRKDCERFFRSGWFQTLTSLDGEVLIEKLHREVYGGDGEISVKEDGTVTYYNTFNLTNYDATDTLKVHLFKTTGEEVVIELEKEE